MNIKSVSVLIAALLIGLTQFAPAQAQAQNTTNAEWVETMPMPVQAFDWTGPYAGLQAGEAWDRQRFNYLVLNSSKNVNADGFVGGITAGYNFRTGPWVYGA